MPSFVFKKIMNKNAETQKKIRQKNLSIFFLPWNFFFLFLFLLVTEFSFSYIAFAQSIPETKLLIQSHRTLETSTGESISFQIGFKNTGNEIWNREGDNKVTVESVEQNPLYHSSWKTPKEAASMLMNKAKPGEIAFFSFKLQAPSVPGVYEGKFQLIFEDALKIKNGDFTLRMNTTAPPTSATTFTNLTQEAAIESILQNQTPKKSATLAMAEPNIRVGLYHSFHPVVITSAGPYEIRDLVGNLLFSINAGGISSSFFDVPTTSYLISTGGNSKNVRDGVRFISLSTEIPFEIKNFENRPQWNLTLNDNIFLGNIEIRYNAKKNHSWVINELPLEKYLRGLGESSNSSPEEFQKSLAIAARTYALYHFLNPKKHADEFFTVDSVYDQIYRGENLAKRLKRFTQAVEKTRGEVVSYQNQVVITPFFSQSDGKTKSWTEVWGGGSKPWLNAVNDPWNQGKKLLGHGVGLSAQGAIGLAQENDYTYQQILKHYYTSIDIQKLY